MQGKTARETIKQGLKDVAGAGEIIVKGAMTTAKRIVGDDSPTKLSPNAQRMLDKDTVKKGAKK
jgi:hypothetical protein